MGVAAEGLGEDPDGECEDSDLGAGEGASGVERGKSDDGGV